VRRQLVAECFAGIGLVRMGLELAISNLSHSALGLDFYAWLAQRLHRVSRINPQFITWAALKDQFGYHYGAMFKFKQVFRQTLRSVKTQYPAARFDLDGKGMTLIASPPPVSKRFVAVGQPVARVKDHQP